MVKSATILYTRDTRKFLSFLSSQHIYTYVCPSTQNSIRYRQLSPVSDYILCINNYLNDLRCRTNMTCILLPAPNLYQLDDET